MVKERVHEKWQLFEQVRKLLVTLAKLLDLLLALHTVS